LLNKRIMSLIPSGDQDEVHNFFSTARQNSTSESADIHIIGKNQRVKTFSWNVLWSPQEELLFCVAHDVSELRRIEQAKRDFVNMVSHDIRTPLSGMAIFLEMIPMGVYGQLNESGVERAGALGSALNRIVAMVNDLLDIEKMQSGQFQIFKTEVDSNALVKSSIEMVQGYAEQQQVNLNCENTDGVLACDEARIIQVLQNLLSNAIKFSQPGKTVTLRAERQADVTRFEVIDNGKGIAEDDIPILFDRFTQAKDDGSPRKAGFGLGLAICKDIVDRHGGQIGIISKVGVGSTFWLALPNQDPDSAETSALLQAGEEISITQLHK
jgi:signal transduction histidine kinase